ncbi:EpsD family peptidyl-prolyl cis-trans isomerase [Massilia sp. DWR3-1-1]|uniref:EpsD family peptidyl-prolyl cis-trans isomerase n=1 Tax=Massilia sp. DWR3-1-1 TaxID=2804559 RepID=UPI003CF685CD
MDFTLCARRRAVLLPGLLLGLLLGCGKAPVTTGASAPAAAAVEPGPQQLLSNAAVQARLDQRPDVVSALEQARRAVLVRAYTDSIASGIAQPSDERVQGYFTAHPELFAHRRIYRLQEIVVPKLPANSDELVRSLSLLKTYQQVADKLASLKIAYTTAVALKPVESLPADLLREMLTMKNGDAFVIEKDGGVAFMQITGVEEQPATLGQASAAISALLRTQDIAEAMRGELARLQAGAKGEAIAANGAPAR